VTYYQEYLHTIQYTPLWIPAIIDVTDTLSLNTSSISTKNIPKDFRVPTNKNCVVVTAVNENKTCTILIVE